MSEKTPRLRLSVLLCALALLAAPASAAALDNAGYWAFADRMQAPIDRHWNDDAGVFNAFKSWYTDAPTQKMILVDNPAKLYRF